MSNYSGMTNEMAAAQYAEDCGREQEKAAYIERLVKADMAELNKHGRTTEGVQFEKLLDEVNENFASEFFYSNYHVNFNDEQKIACMDKFKSMALRAIEVHLYDKYEEEL